MLDLDDVPILLQQALEGMAQVWIQAVDTGQGRISGVEQGQQREGAFKRAPGHHDHPFEPRLQRLLRRLGEWAVRVY
ncbi:hypothetical protein D3C78_1855770 [compost metagenome]